LSDDPIVNLPGIAIDQPGQWYTGTDAFSWWVSSRRGRRVFPTNARRQHRRAQTPRSDWKMSTIQATLAPVAARPDRSGASLAYVTGRLSSKQQKSSRSVALFSLNRGLRRYVIAS